MQAKCSNCHPDPRQLGIAFHRRTSEVIFYGPWPDLEPGSSSITERPQGQYWLTLRVKFDHTGRLRFISEEMLHIKHTLPQEKFKIFLNHCMMRLPETAKPINEPPFDPSKSFWDLDKMDHVLYESIAKKKQLLSK